MNSKQLTEICQVFELGIPINAPTRVYGGLLHLVWRITTDKASYAIKQLSQDIDLGDENIKKNYELTERVASHFFEQGIPAISAIEKEGRHLIEIDGTGFLIYPWIEAEALDKDKISEHHALRIPEILAKMHTINLEMPEILEPEFDIHLNESILKLISKAEIYNCPFANHLMKNQEDIIAINDAYQNAIPFLKKYVVVSHGDLDQKNVLWDMSGNSILIDWESARKLNPTYEIVNASLDWSGITTGAFSKELFIKMVQTYIAAGGSIDKNLLQAAFWGVLGNWLNWMCYNIERACVTEESESKNLGIEQVNQVLATIIQLKDVISELRVIIIGKL